VESSKDIIHIAVSEIGGNSYLTATTHFEKWGTNTGPDDFNSRFKS
jgi:hypothetical protein